MVRIQSWSIRARLVLALIGVLIPFLALAGLGVVGIGTLWRNVKNINDEAVKVVKETADLQLALLELSKPVTLYLAVGDPAAAAQFEERLARVQELLARMETPVFRQIDERHLLEAVRGQLPRVEALSREILAVQDPRADRTAPEKMMALVKLSDRATMALSELHETSRRKMEAEFARVLDTIWQDMAYGLGILVLSMAGGVAMALVFSAWVSRPLFAIAEGSRRMAAGDLSQRVEATAGAELGETARAFNEMAERLEASTGELARSVEELRALRDVSQAVSSSLDLGQVLDTITGHAVRLSSSDACAIFEFDVSRRVFAGGASRNLSREFLDTIQTMRVDPTKAAVWQAAESGQPVQIADVASADDYPYREVTLTEGFRALLAVPMGGETVARGIVLFRRTPGVFDERVVHLLTALANQSKVAIENARLFQEIQSQRTRLENLSKNLKQLYGLSTAIQEPLSLKEQLTRVLEAAREVVSIDRFYIWAVNPAGDKLVNLAGAGFSEQEQRGLEGTEIPLVEAGAMYKAYRESVSLVFNEQNSLPPELRLRPPYSELKAIRTKSFLVVPMIARGRTVGLLSADNKLSGEPILPQTVELLQTFASHAAIAVENARLFQELEEKGRQIEIASRHKSQFLANMSHELRTPLNAILGYTKLILDNIYGQVPEKIGDVMERVEKSGRHLLGLINDVLDLSKIEAGQLTLSLTEYSLKDVVQTVVAAVEALAAEKTLALRVSVPPDLPPGRGDERRIAQVLLNLVGNAIKFTEAGEVRVLAAMWEGAFLISVADTGPGIAPADQELIFEEFQQINSTSSRRKGGTGLGLAIAKRIVELHSGRIWVESTPGQGSTFWFTLPLRVEGPRPA